MPKLSDSMEQGTILKWLKADGESVAVGDELVEIETDKATMTYVSELEGVLEIVVAEGETVPAGTVIAHIGEAKAAAAEPVDARVPVAAAVSAPAGRAGSNGALASTSAEVRATPLAKRFAREHRIDLGDVAGSGPRGRITRADVALKAGVEAPLRPGVEAAPRPGAEAPPQAPAPPSARPPASAPRVGATGAPAAGGNKGATRTEELTRLQQTVARRMAEAKATVPDFQVQTEVAMDEAITVRARLKELAGDAPAPSLNDFVIKACALALRRHPRANGSYLDARFELHERINIGFAVASEDALVVPTVADADMKSLGQIAAETRRLAARVRAGQISPPELSGGTFTVSNLGMFGMTAITPVINRPQAAILGVGALREVLARVGEDLVDRTLMTLTLSCDHRILYGADAARFLAEIKALLAAPLAMAL
jgi:pyruvate dehydrogenase E2 component (dihydrolipoamide acetyltransferase)